jgi:hypothetical protein
MVVLLMHSVLLDIVGINRLNVSVTQRDTARS